MSKYYSTKGLPPQVGNPKNSNKFDMSLNSSTWVEYILNLRNNESALFGIAHETIKYESRVEFWYPRPPRMTAKKQAE